MTKNEILKMIKDMFSLPYRILLLLTIIATIAGLMTLMPRSAASYPNILGYKSLCTFTPAGTFFCFFIAGSSCFIRSTFVKDRKGSVWERLKQHRKGIFVLAIVLCLAAFSTVWFFNNKAKYPDTSTTATT
ncbi:MAG: hypothetical protein DRP87_12465 [Spirochaetes bacterium]|nr:MAG: hypothetical protein DRP87_12465 [Spirochaetota bacterium]